jgi:hypothetical protein
MVNDKVHSTHAMQQFLKLFKAYIKNEFKSASLWFPVKTNFIDDSGVSFAIIQNKCAIWC